jgi:hypothetical protein
MLIKRILAVSLVLSPLIAEVMPTVPFAEPQGIVIYNRILARVGSKTISVLDVMKKMDTFLTANYPQAMDSRIARYQFYSANWRAFFEQMVDGELILADVGDKDLKITEGEVREAILQRFGPNVMSTLDKCGLTYLEAHKMIRDEIVVQRMTWFKVQAKALQQVGPGDLREAYQQYLSQHPSEQEWSYQVLSIRSPHTDLSMQLANEAFSLLHEAKTDFSLLQAKLEEKKAQNPEVSFSVSELLTATERTISNAHRKGLEGLKPGECSQPIMQVSGNNPVQRIFFLKEQRVKSAPAFKDLKEELERNKLNDLIQTEDRVYKQKLRQRYNHLIVLEPLPTHFEPFSLEFDKE